MLEGCLEIMCKALELVIGENKPSIYLFGSAALGDFRPGWSDIDILCLCQRPLSEAQAQRLVGLRQDLVSAHGDAIFRGFEGGILSWDSLLNGHGEPVVYWGTSGQRVTDRFELDAFSRYELIRHGRLLAGEDHRDRIALPGYDALCEAVERHLKIIRQYGRETDESLYSAGWMLDIARCLYTLEHGAVIAKTEAGHWALEMGLAPEQEVLARVVAIRENPCAVGEGERVFLKGLGPHVQRFADVLAARLVAVKKEGQA